MNEDRLREEPSASRETLMRRETSRSLQVALIERGLWADVRARLARVDPDAMREIERADGSEWMSVLVHLALLDVVASCIGLDAVRDLACERVRGMQLASFYPTIVGSWTRTFREGAQIVQLFPHLWKATSRNAGELVVRELSDQHAIFRFGNCDRALCLSAPWRATLEGFGLGLLARVELKGIATTTLIDGGDAVDFELSWSR